MSNDRLLNYVSEDRIEVSAAWWIVSMKNHIDKRYSAMTWFWSWSGTKSYVYVYTYIWRKTLTYRYAKNRKRTAAVYALITRSYEPVWLYRYRVAKTGRKLCRCFLAKHCVASYKRMKNSRADKSVNVDYSSRSSSKNRIIPSTSRLYFRPMISASRFFRFVTNVWRYAFWLFFFSKRASNQR